MSGGQVTAVAAGDELCGYPDGETIAGGLNEPVAPRWHDGRLLVLERGDRALTAVDPSDGRVERIAKLPGPPSGLAVARGLAIATVSGSRPGVSAIDLSTGASAGFLRLGGGVRAVHAVAVLDGVDRAVLA